MHFNRERKRVEFIFEDAEIFDVKADYEVFHAIVDGIRLIFYPHKTGGTNNIHLRVRNGSPRRQEEFIFLAAILQSSQNLCCTFTVKNNHHLGWHNESVQKMKAKFYKYKKYWENAEILKEKGE